MGPVTGCVVRGFLADATMFASAKAAASYVGLNPSTWSSGTVSQPSRAITKEGPAVLRLAFFQAANARPPPRPAAGRFYYRLMTEHGHCHTQATRGGRPETGRADLDRAHPRQPYQLQDVDGAPIGHLEAKKVIKAHYTVPEQVRAKARAHSAATNRAKLTR